MICSRLDRSLRILERNSVFCNFYKGLADGRMGIRHSPQKVYFSIVTALNVPAEIPRDKISVYLSLQESPYVRR